MKHIVNEEITAVVKPRTITLELTEQEAGFVAAVLGKACSGIDTTGIVYNALRDFVGEDKYENIYKDLVVGCVEFSESKLKRLPKPLDIL